MADEYSARQKIDAIRRVAVYHPSFTVGVIGLSILAAFLEGVGLGFILPIIELAQGEVDPDEETGLVGIFVAVYAAIGLPFTLGFLISGVAVVMTVRFASSFLVSWLTATIRTRYVKELQTESFERALDAEISYFDKEGSDDILNAIVTQAGYAGRVIEYVIRIIEQGFLAAIYLLIALLLAPLLTVVAVVVLGVVVVFFKYGLEGGSTVGNRVADANEEIQRSVQAGTQGIRDVKMFGVQPTLLNRFYDAIDRYASATIAIARNQAILKNAYQLVLAVTVFVLIYVALVFTTLSLAALAVFLFAIFQLGPKVSTLSTYLYRLDSYMPHLIRTQQFIDELGSYQEPTTVTVPTPSAVDRVEFDNVWFSYDGTDEAVLRGVTFEVSRGDFIAFVGPSGAGKSTIVSLLARMYKPDEGEIRANGVRLADVSIDRWRDRVSVVRQNPFIFNETLYWNVTIANQDASRDTVERVCEIAQVTEFLEDLPNGFETRLGDDGVRLSGGQRQRVAIARALLKDADILLLDEATSDLDTELEERVHSAIERIDREYAIVVVAHRLSTVTNADRIYAMERGKVVEQGAHHELLRQDGRYANLYNRQVVSGNTMD